MARNLRQEIQRAVNNTMRADTDLAALIGTRIYDEPPQQPTFPFVRFVLIDNEARHTDGTGTIISTVSLQVQSRPQDGSRIEASNIIDAVRVALDRQESAMTANLPDPMELVSIDFLTDNITRDDPDRGWVGTIFFQLTIDLGNF